MRFCFLVVDDLMLVPRRNVTVRVAVHLVAMDESMLRQSVQHLCEVNFVVWKAVELQFVRFPSEPAFAIGDDPKAFKGEPQRHSALLLGKEELSVPKKLGLNCPDASHGPNSVYFRVCFRQNFPRREGIHPRRGHRATGPQPSCQRDG